MNSSVARYSAGGRMPSKTSEELWVEPKLDTHTARVMAATPDGRRRVAETIAKQFNVPDKLINDCEAGRSAAAAHEELTGSL